MNDSKISVRYAKALFESAKEKNLLDEVRADMEAVQEICMIPDFNGMLDNPVMKESQKSAVLDKVLGKIIQPLTMSLLNLVFQNGRELFIPAIARNYIAQYKKYKGIISATFTSAVPIDATLTAKVELIVQKALNTSVELKTEENEDLIGGFVIRIDDQQYDASVASSLKEVKKQLLN